MDHRRCCILGADTGRSRNFEIPPRSLISKRKFGVDAARECVNCPTTPSGLPNGK